MDPAVVGTALNKSHWRVLDGELPVRELVGTHDEGACRGV